MVYIPYLIVSKSHLFDLLEFMKHKNLGLENSLEKQLEEKTLLLSVSEAISKTTNPIELLAAVRENVMKLIPFHDTGILIVEKDGLHHYDMAVNYNSWDDTEGNRKLRELGLFKLSHPGSYVEYVMRLIEKSQSPVIEDYVYRYKEFDYPFFQILDEAGYKEGLVFALKSAGKTFGTFWLNSLAKNHFKKEQFRLFQAIAEQVGVAVANILATEEILEKNRTKAILLKISEHIAAINNRKELLSIIINEIKPIIPIDDTAIVILNKAGTKFQDWTNIDNYQETASATNLKKAGFTEYIEIDRLTALSFTDTAILTIDDYLKEKHPFAPIMAQAGLKEFMFTPLVSQGKTIGSLFFDAENYGTYSEKYFDTFRSIANMIASAVANIISNEQILEREREKTLLYKIASAIANVKDRDTLMKLILEEVKSIFNFYDIGLAILDKDEINCTDWATFTPDISPSDANYAIHYQGLTKLPFKDSLFEKTVLEVQAAGHPLIYKFDEQLKNDNPDLKELLDVELEHGYKETLVTYLKSGNKIIGMFNVNSLTDNHFKPSQFYLFQAVADLIAVAVANIQANEEILEREREKSQLLEISEAIATVQNSKQLLKVIYEKIQPAFDYDSAGLFVLDKEAQNFYEITDNEVLPDAVQNEITKRNLLGPFTITEFTKDFWFNYEKPTITTIKQQAEYVYSSAGKAQFEIGIAHGLKDFICGPLNCAGKKIGMLCFSVKKENFYTYRHIHLFKSISDLIAVAVANVLANEEILEKEKEKGQLLIEIRELNDQLKEQNSYLIDEVEANYDFEEIVGQSSTLKDVFKNISIVGATDTTVLIMGETGTGKELFARALHNLSPRKSKPLIKLNCAALPPQLVESELFGHERGAFTGALDRRIGKFEIADGSTLFLDEIGELPLDLQAKLLRAIQEKEVERLGSNKVIKVNVRIVAATNRNLAKEVQAGKFRSDLFFRLDTFPIILPALRDRKDDIPLLASHFIDKCCKKLGRKIEGISKRGIQELMAYPWPGNIRELEHVIERSVLLCKNKVIQEFNLPVKQLAPVTTSIEDFKIKTWEENERDFLLSILERCGGRVRGTGGAAELLNLPPTTLDGKIRKLGLKKNFMESKKQDAV